MTIVGLGVFLVLLAIVFEIFKIALDVAGTILYVGLLVLVIGAIYAFARGIMR